MNNYTRRRIFSAIGLLLLTPPALQATVYDTTWLGGSGEWYNTAKWSLHTLPINTATDQYNVYIPASPENDVNAGNGVVNTVTLDAGSRMDVGSATKLTASGGMTLDGYVAMTANSILHVGDNQAFNGTGSINFFFGPCTVAATGGSLTIGPGLTVGASVDPEASSGTIGDLSYPLINHGTIASLCTYGSTITVDAQSFSNDGTLLIGAHSTIQLNTTLKRLSDIGPVSNPASAGTLRLIGTVDNSASTFVLDGSIPGLVVGGSIVGGTVTATGSNVLQTGTLLLDNVTLAAPVVVATLKIRTGQTLTGSADIRLPSSGTSITSDTPTGTLTLGAGLNIHGTGTIGQTTAPLVNHTTITADVPNQLLTITGNAFTNDGLFRTTNNAILAFAGTYTLNSLGTIVNDGGSLQLAGTLNNTGQTLTSGSPHTWQLAGQILGGIVEASDPNAPLLVPLNSIATLNGVTLNGTVQLSRYSTLLIPGPLVGHATVLLGGTSSLINNTLQPTINTPDLILGPDVTIRGGSGTIGPSSSNALINHGLIRAEQGDTLTLQGLGITSDGTLSLDAGSIVQTHFSSLSLGNGGTLSLQVGGPAPQAVLNIQGNLNLSGLDSLDLFPLGDTYTPLLIATYTGSLAGTFDYVSPGYVIDYSTPQKIYAIALPEPSSLAIAALGFFILPRRPRY